MRLKRREREREKLQHTDGVFEMHVKRFILSNVVMYVYSLRCRIRILRFSHASGKNFNCNVLMLFSGKLAV